MFQKIAVAYENHPESARVLRHAIELSKAFQVPLMVLTIAEPLPAYTAFAAADPGALHTIQEDRSEFYGSLREQLALTGKAEGVVMETHTLESNHVKAIVDFVQSHHIDLLVVGLHRQTLRISSLWSTVYSLAQELSCSLLGVH